MAKCAYICPPKMSCRVGLVFWAFVADSRSKNHQLPGCLYLYTKFIHPPQSHNWYEYLVFYFVHSCDIIACDVDFPVWILLDLWTESGGDSS